MKVGPFEREVCKDTRTMLLSRVNRKINLLCKIYKPLLSKVGRCYYVVRLENIKDVRVLVLSAEAPLDPVKRSQLSNKELYAKKAYWGYVEYTPEGEGRFKRQTKIKDTVTYANGQVVLELSLREFAGEFTNADVRQAFKPYLK